MRVIAARQPVIPDLPPDGQEVDEELVDELLEDEEFEDGVEVSEEADEEPEDENVYDDFGGGGGQGVPEYYGGGGGGSSGGGGGGGYYTPTPQAPATPAVTPAVPVEATPAVTLPAAGTPAAAATAITKFVNNLKTGRVTPKDVAAAASAASAAGMSRAADKIRDMASKAGVSPPSGPSQVKRPAAPKPKVPPPKGAKTGRAAVRPPARVTNKQAKSGVQPPAGRKFHGLDLEDEMPTLISDIDSFGLEDVDGLAQQGADEMLLDDSSFGEEGDIPGFEIDESGSYIDESDIPDSAVEMEPWEPAQQVPQSYGQPQDIYQPSYSPSQAGYGYPQQGYSMDPYGMQQGYQQQPYGYDPYAQQGGYGYDPYAAQQQGYDPYAQQPTGYDPQTGQPIYGGAQQQLCPNGQAPTQYDPTTGQPVCGQDASSMFPAGTPQVIVDAATAILNGTATLPVIQAAVKQAQSMGYGALANQLIALYQQYGGQYTAAAGTPGATTGKATQEAKAATMFGPLPTDAATCKTELLALMKTATFKAAMAAIKDKSTLTAEQRAYFSRFTQLKKCSGYTAGTMSGGRSGTTLTNEQRAAGCKQMVSRGGQQWVKCPAPGEKVQTSQEKFVGKQQSKYSLAVMAVTKFTSNLIAACGKEGGGKCKSNSRFKKQFDNYTKGDQSWKGKALKQSKTQYVEPRLVQAVVAVAEGEGKKIVATLPNEDGIRAGAAKLEEALKKAGISL